MNYRKIMLVALVLLVVLTIGAVSASGDADNLAAEGGDDLDIESPLDDEILSLENTAVAVGDGNITDGNDEPEPEIDNVDDIDVNGSEVDDGTGEEDSFEVWVDDGPQGFDVSSDNLSGYFIGSVTVPENMNGNISIITENDESLFNKALTDFDPDLIRDNNIYDITLGDENGYIFEGVDDGTLFRFVFLDDEGSEIWGSSDYKLVIEGNTIWLEELNDDEINDTDVDTPEEELNNLIMDADEGSTLILDKDYIFSGPIEDYTSIGITIGKSMTIDGQGHTIDANNYCTIFAIDGPGITLKNIIFRNGHVSDDWSGGAIGGGNSDLCVVNCTFENNIATDTDNAGAIAMIGDNIAIINSTFINNEGYNWGSIRIHGSGAIISNCVFMNNRANVEDESETTGGAISIYGESAAIVDCVFSNNTADLGSDIYIRGSSENFIIESCNSDAGDSSIYFAESNEGGDDEFDPTKFSIDRRDDENNILALNVPVFSLYCPDGSEGTVDVTVSYNGNDYSVSKNISDMDENNYLHWYLNDLNMNLLVKYEIHVNVNDGEFESHFDAYVHGPVSSIDDKLYTNTFFDYLFIYFEVPSEYDDARVIVEFDGKNIFNKTLKEFEHADVANESYYWYHPSYGPGPGDERFKHYVVYNGVFGDIEAKTYNVTASIIFENSPIIGNHTFISTGTIDVVEGIVENKGVKMEAAHDRNYNLNDDDASILFITAPEGANGKVTVSLNDKIIFESNLDELDSEDGYYLLRLSKLELDEGEYELTFAYFEDDEKIVETSELFTFFHGSDDEGDDADDGVVIWVIEGDDKEFDFTNSDDRNSAFAYISVSNDLDGTIVFFYFAEDEDEVQDFYHIDLSDVNIKYADEEREGFTIYELSFNSVGGQSEIFEGADWFRFAFVTNYGEGEAESEVDSRKYDIEHDGNIIKFWQTNDEEDDKGELREDVLINGGNVVNNDVIISIPASLRYEVDDEFVVFMDEWDPAHFKFSELENEDGFYCIRISDLFAAEEINEGMGVNMIVQFYKEGENAYYAQPEDDEWGIELYTSPFLVEKAYILEDRMVISFRGFEGVDDEFTVTVSRDDFETAVVMLKISELTNLDDDIEGGFYEIHLSDLGIAEPGNYNIEVNFTANGEQALYNFGNVVVENLLIRAHGPDDDEDPVWRDVSNTVFHFGVTEDVAGFIKLFIGDEQVGGNISFTNFVFDDWPSHYGRQIILNDFQISKSGNYVLKVEAYDGEGNFLADCENNIEVEVTDNDVEFISGPYGNDIFVEFRIGTPLSDGQYYNIYLNGELAGNFTADYGVTVSDEYVDKLFEVKLLKPGHYDVNVTFFDGEKENDFKTGEIDINSLDLISDKTIYVYNVDDVLISFEMDGLLEGYVLEAYYLKNWNRMDIYEEMLFNPYDSEGMMEDGLYEDGVVTINFAWSHHADEPSYMLDPGINYLHVKYRHENDQGISYGGIIAVRVIEAIIFVDEETSFPTSGENVDDGFAAISLPDDIDGIVVISCGDTVFFNKTLSTFDEGKLGPEDDMEDGIRYVVSPQDVGFFEGLNDEDEIEIAVYDNEGNMLNSNRYFIFFEDDSFRLERIDDEEEPSDYIELNFEEEDDEPMSFEMGDDVTIAYLLIPDTEEFEDTIATIKIYKNGEVVQTIVSSDIERVLLGSREAYQYAIKVDLTKFEDNDLIGIWADCFDEDGRLWEYAVQIDGNNVIFHEYSGSQIEYYVFYGNITKGDLNGEDLMGEHPNGRFVSWGISDVFNITEGTIVIRDGETTIAEYSLDDCNVAYSYNILGNVYYLSLDDNNLSNILPENRNVTFTFSYVDESLTFKRIRQGDYVYKVLTPDDFDWQEWSNFNFIIPDNISDENDGAVYILGYSNMQSVYVDFGGGYFSIYVNDTKVENLGHVLYRAWLNYPLEFNDEKIIISPDGDDYVVGIGTTEPISGRLTLDNENVVLCDIDISKDDENWKIDEFGRYHYEVSLKDISLDGVNNGDELRLVFFNDEDGYDRYFEIEIGDNFILLHPVELESYDAWGSELRLVNLRDGHHSLSDFILSLADLGITESGTYNIRITHFPSVKDGLEYQGKYCDDVENHIAEEYLYIAETELVNKDIIVDLGELKDSSIELGDIGFNYNETGSANVSLVGAKDITAFVIDHDEAKVTFNDGVITVSGLDAGNYTLNVTTVPEEGFTASSILVDFTVNKIDANLTVEADNVNVGETTTIKVYGFGIVNVRVGVNTYAINCTGVGYLVLSFDAGTYNVTANFEGDKNINPAEAKTTFTVSKLTPEILITTGEAIEGSDLDVTVEIANATGIVAINGANITLKDGKASTTIKDVAAGDLDIVAAYFGDAKYIEANATKKVTVNAKENPDLIANVENINVGETAIVNIEINANVTGKVTVDGNEVTIANGKGTYSISNLTAGTYTVAIAFAGDKYFNAANITKTFEVSKVAAPEIIIDVEESVVEGSDLAVDVTLAGATGTVNINGADVALKDGKASTTINNVTVGDLTISVAYSGDDKYLNASNSANVNVYARKDANLTAGATNINVGDVAIIDITINKNATGKVTVNGDDVTITNGTAKYEIKDLTAGNYTYDVKFAGDKYFNAAETSVAFKVSKLASEVKITVGSAYNVGESFTIAIANNTAVVVTIKGNAYAIKDGKVDIDTTALTAGSYTVVANITESDKYLASSDDATFTVSKVAAPAVVIDVESSVVEGTDLAVEVTVAGATGTVIINGEEKQLNNSKASAIIKNVTVGDLTISVAYSGDDKYLNASNSTTVNVFARKDAELTAVGADINVGEVAEISMTINKDVTGKLTVNGEEVTVVNGTAKYPVAGLTAGNHTFTVKFAGDMYFNADETTVAVKVSKLDSVVKVTVGSAYNVGDSFIIGVNATTDAVVSINGQNYTVKDGAVVIDTTKLAAGSYTVVANITENDKFLASSDSASFTISKLVSSVKVTVGSAYNVGDSFTIAITNNTAAVVTINGNAYAIKDGAVVIDTTTLAAGSYTVVANIAENDKYLASSDIATFIISKVAAPAVVIGVESSVVEGTDLAVEVTVAGATGAVIINGEEKQLNNSKASAIIKNVTVGDLTISVAYSGDAKYLNASNSTTVNVFARKDAELTAVGADINVGEVAEITMTINKDVIGKLIVNGEEVTVVDGTAKYPVAGLTAGNHTFTVKFAGDKYFNAAETTVVVKVSKVASSVKVTVGSAYNVGDSFTISIANSTAVKVVINGQEYAVKDGAVVIDTTKLAAGSYVVVASIAEEDMFLASSDSASFEVSKVETPAGENPFNFDENKTVESKTPTYSIDLPQDATGTLTVTIDGKNYTAEVKDGKATVEVKDMPAGSYDVTITYSGDDKYSPIVKTSKATVKVDPRIVAKNAKVQYTAGKYYSVTVYGADGKVAAGTEVIFTLNNKQVAKTTTDANGVAKFKVTQTPVTNAKIVVKALGVTETKKLTITHAATLSTVTVKKSAKKITLKVTVKVNGKAVKNKVVKFKFNNKLVKTKKALKTNSKGVATVVVPTNYYKNLKVGKTVIYQVTYLKDTVKKSTKVKA